MFRYFIPHLLTLLNLLCGSIAVILAVQNHLVLAAIFVGIGIFFDFFDGFTARMLGVSGELGKQLDSLADVVTSGLAPSIVMFQLIVKSLGESPESYIYNWEERPTFYIGFPPLALISLLIVLSSAYRLAKFNIDERQTSSFIGLPTPANAILIMSLPLINAYQDLPSISYYLFNTWFLVGLSLFSTLILNVDMRMFGLKFQNWSFRHNWFRYLFVLICIVLLIYLQLLALPLLILIYILFSAILDYLEIE